MWLVRVVDLEGERGIEGKKGRTEGAVDLDALYTGFSFWSWHLCLLVGSKGDEGEEKKREVEVSREARSGGKCCGCLLAFTRFVPAGAGILGSGSVYGKEQ